MNVMLRIIFMLISFMLASQAWGYLPTTVLNYNSDDAGYFVVDQNIQLKIGHCNYDDTLNLRHCCRGSLDRNQQEKTQDGLFSALIDGLLVPQEAGKEIGILRDAAKGKGNFGLGSGARTESDKLGQSWVGDGYKVASDGKTLVSKDGLRQYRPPSYMPNLDKTQAIFEQRFPGQNSTRWQSNGHLDITD